MNIPILLVATSTHWIGTARIPATLVQSGFEVSLLTPKGSLAAESRFVSKVGYLPDNATFRQWVTAFAAAVKATAPRIVVPCDDMAFRLLAMLMRSPRGLQPDLQLQLASLIRESLGDPDYYDISVDKTLLPSAAEGLGVRMPPYAIATTSDAAGAFAAAHGYPVVLKRAHGFAGQGVAICASREELTQAFDAFTRANAEDLGETGAKGHLVQASIPGRVQYYLGMAWRGELLAGGTSETVVAYPAPIGPPTVCRYFSAPRVRDTVATLVRRFGISGHFFVEFITAGEGNEPYLLEINRRVTPGSHCGRALKVDLWGALHARLQGTVLPVPTDLDEGVEGIIVFFPQEWLRDPDSRYLRDYPVDVPWDEPELIEAMLKLRH